NRRERRPTIASSSVNSARPSCIGAFRRVAHACPEQLDRTPTAASGLDPRAAPVLTYGAGMTRERAALLKHLEAERKHVLVAVGGLDEGNLTRTVAPSGWSIAQLLNHLTYDDEVFWAAAIVGGDEEAIGLIRDGWKVPVASGAEAVERYQHWV